MLLLGLIGLVLAAGCAPNLVSQGRKLSSEGEHDRAIELLHQYLVEHPERLEAWRELGAAYYRKGDLDQAEEALSRAEATDATARLYEGLVFEARDDYSRSIDAYTEALRLGPAKETALLVRVHLDQLIRKNIRRQISQAIGDESAIDVESIPPNTVAVTDFDGSYLSEETAPIARGLAELTAADLAKVESLQLVERLKIKMLMKELELGAGGAVSPASAPRVGRLLGSNRVVTGSVIELDEERIRLDGAIVSVRDSSASLPEPTEGELKEFFDIQKDLVFKIVEDMGVSLTTAERDAIREVPTESYLAFLAYCRGLHYRANGLLAQAQTEFENALGYDGGFDQARVQLESVKLAQADEVSADDLESAITEYAGLEGRWPGRDWRLAWLLKRTELRRKDPKRPPVGDDTGNVIVRGDLDAQ
jgi:tetratricopeptide (TPR) repeat protein